MLLLNRIVVTLLSEDVPLPTVKLEVHPGPRPARAVAESVVAAFESYLRRC
jgi:hypothetical protein